MAIFTGFDAIERSAPLAPQLSIGCVGVEYATVIDGRGGGNAIRMADMGYFYIPTEKKYNGHYAALGVAIRISNMSAANGRYALLAAINRDSSPSSDLPGTPTLGFIYKNGWIEAIQAGSANIPLIQAIENQWMYLELRGLCSSSSMIHLESTMYINGIKVHTTEIPYYTYLSYINAYIGRSMSNVFVDIDDIYFEHHAYQDEATIPILASGKVSCKPLTSTLSNNWTVTGGNAANTVLSDNDDTTFINSNNPATAIMEIDRDIPDIYGLNVNIRGKTENNGVVTVGIEKDGVALINEQPIGLQETMTTTTLKEVALNDETKNWTDVIKNGAQLKVTT